MKHSLLAFALLTMPARIAYADASHKEIPPSPREYVYDETGKLSDTEKQSLFNRLSREDRTNGNQVLVAFFNSVDNEDPVDYTNRVFKAWNPGAKGKNNGLLVAAYLKEHQLRIEVGYGLEPYVTDAKSKDVILNDLTPAFKAGEFDQGVDQAVSHLIQIVHQGQGVTDAQTEGQSMPTNAAQASLGAGGGMNLNFIILIIIAFAIIRPLLGAIILLFFPSLRTWFLFSLLFGGFGGGRGGGGFFGGGGFGGGGFGGGGGGFSGGGGSSGGGGASGSW